MQMRAQALEAASSISPTPGGCSLSIPLPSSTWVGPDLLEIRIKAVNFCFGFHGRRLRDAPRQRNADAFAQAQETLKLH